MQARFSCDQCTYEEWRDIDDTVSLCPVCGYMRWGVVATAPEPSPPDDEGAAEPD